MCGGEALGDRRWRGQLQSSPLHLLDRQLVACLRGMHRSASVYHQMQPWTLLSSAKPGTMHGSLVHAECIHVWTARTARSGLPRMRGLHLRVLGAPRSARCPCPLFTPPWSDFLLQLEHSNAFVVRVLPSCHARGSARSADLHERHLRDRGRRQPLLPHAPQGHGAPAGWEVIKPLPFDGCCLCTWRSITLRMLPVDSHLMGARPGRPHLLYPKARAVASRPTCLFGSW